MVRNDDIPRCKYYIYATNKFITKGNKELKIKPSKAVDLWCADSSFEAQDARGTLSSNKNYSNVIVTEVKPKFSKNNVSLAVTISKPSFVFGDENHQKFVKDRSNY